MNYKIGDIVYRKDENSKPPYSRKYIFLGTTLDKDLRTVRIIKETVGDRVEIGMFISKPVNVKTSDDSNYYTDVFLYDVELFEKVENLNEI